MTSHRIRAQRRSRHEQRCPVCGWPIRSSLQWHFRELLCGGCDTYLRWMTDDQGSGRWVKADLCA